MLLVAVFPLLELVKVDGLRSVCILHDSDCDAASNSMPIFFLSGENLKKSA